MEITCTIRASQPQAQSDSIPNAIELGIWATSAGFFNCRDRAVGTSSRAWNCIEAIDAYKQLLKNTINMGFSRCSVGRQVLSARTELKGRLFWKQNLQ